MSVSTSGRATVIKTGSEQSSRLGSIVRFHFWPHNFENMQGVSRRMQNRASRKQTLLDQHHLTRTL
eukprot:15789-Amphidinium_carterae.1